MTDIMIKRVYEDEHLDDGFRVLVDRLWPRGISKERMHADLWFKDAAPTTELRVWFNHERSKLEGFKRRYFLELDAQPEAVAKLLDEAGRGRLTLLFAAHDTECNHAMVLREYLISHSRKKAG